MSCARTAHKMPPTEFCRAEESPVHCTRNEHTHTNTYVVWCSARARTVYLFDRSTRGIVVRVAAICELAHVFLQPHVLHNPSYYYLWLLLYETVYLNKTHMTHSAAAAAFCRNCVPMVDFIARLLGAFNGTLRYRKMGSIWCCWPVKIDIQHTAGRHGWENCFNLICRRNLPYKMEKTDRPGECIALFRMLYRNRPEFGRLIDFQLLALRIDSPQTMMHTTYWPDRSQRHCGHCLEVVCKVRRLICSRPQFDQSHYNWSGWYIIIFSHKSYRARENALSLHVSHQRTWAQSIHNIIQFPSASAFNLELLAQNTETRTRATWWWYGCRQTLSFVVWRSFNTIARRWLSVRSSKRALAETNPMHIVQTLQTRGMYMFVHMSYWISHGTHPPFRNKHRQI